MLITDNYVMVNFPKTGSSFTRDAIKRVHTTGGLRGAMEKTGLVKPRLQELLMVPFYFTKQQEAANGQPDSEHGCVVQIPAAHRSKPVVSVVRDPMARIVSAYEFRSWARHPFPSLEQVTAWFPHYPDLSFEEYIRWGHELSLPFAQPAGARTAIGPLTTQFIRFYARDPLKTFLALRDDTDLRKDYDLHFPKIHFVHTENLNRELHDLLLQLGYPREKIAFILEKEKTNTSPRTRSSYLTPELVARLHHSERFFYQLFPEYLTPAH